MQFVHALLLIGVLALAIPIIIQLLTRRHQRRIRWGAMMFLARAVRKRKRKMLLEEILLLACRCLLPALAALALARPFVTPDSRVPWALVLPAVLLAVLLFGISFALWRYPKWRRLSMAVSLLLAALSAAAIMLERKLNLSRFGGGANKDVALIIDGSASMSLTGDDGKSNFDTALEEAGKYIEEAPRGTAFSIIIGGPVPEILNPVPVSDRRMLRETLKSVKPAQGTMRAPAALTAAAVTLASGNNTVKQIIVLGDGQTAGWDLQSGGRWSTIHSVFRQLRTPPLVAWRTLPLPASIRNLAISDVRLSREVVGTDREVGVAVTVENVGTEAVTPSGVSLRIGGATLTAGDARQLEPGASQTFDFRHRFERAGAARVTAVLNADDDMPSDNTFDLVVPVLGTLRALVVDGDSSGGPLDRASSYVSLALTPRLTGSSGSNGSFLLDATVEDVSRTGSRTDFSEFAFVALCNVQRLPEAAMASLAAYVRSGGGLIFLPGAKPRPEAWNQWLSEGENVLPAKLVKFEANAPASENGPAPSIDPASFAHDALRNLRTGSDLGSVSPLRRWSLDTGFSSGANVAASFTDGRPLFLISQLGRGAVVLSAVPFDAVASDIVSRRSFVPLVHELAYFAARPVAPELNVNPSDGATLLLGPRRAVGAEKAGDNGIRARYHRSKGFRGEPVVRIDRNIDFNWGAQSPFQGFSADNFSVRWTGTLTFPVAGEYEFKVECDDRATLLLDGKQTGNAPRRFNAGEHREIELRYEEDTGVARVSLMWRKPGDADFSPVPFEALNPFSSRGDSGSVVDIVDPRGESFHGELVDTREGSVLRIVRALIPGLYTVKPAAGDSSFPKSTASALCEDGAIRIAVRSSTEESVLQAVSPEQAESLREYVSLSLATKPEDVITLLHGSAFGREVWRIFAFAALLLIVGEIALSRWIALQRRTGRETDVDFTNEGDMGKASFKDALRRLKKG